MRRFLKTLVPSLAMCLPISFLVGPTGLMADEGKERLASDFEKIRKVLEDYDTNGDGRLDAKEREAARRGFTDRFSQSDRAEVMKRFDADGNGRLDEKERMELRKRIEGRMRPSTNSDAPINPEFLKRFDENKNGRLDPKEREAAQLAMKNRRGRGDGSMLNREQVIKRFDANGDGELDQAERQKAFAEMRNRRGNGDSPRRPQQDAPKSRVDKAELVKEFDANGNGRLDADERTKALAALRERSAKNDAEEKSDGSDS